MQESASEPATDDLAEAGKAQAHVQESAAEPAAEPLVDAEEGKHAGHAEADAVEPPAAAPKPPSQAVGKADNGPASALHAMSAKDYLEATVVPLLRRALRDIAQERCVPRHARAHHKRAQL